MKAIDFLTMLVIVTTGLTVALTKLSDLSFPYWRFVAYEDLFLMVLLFCCFYQLARMLGALGEPPS